MDYNKYKNKKDIPKKLIQDYRKCCYCNLWVYYWDCITEGYVCYDCQKEYNVKNINNN